MCECVRRVERQQIRRPSVWWGRQAEDRSEKNEWGRAKWREEGGGELKVCVCVLRREKEAGRKRERGREGGECSSY